MRDANFFTKPADKWQRKYEAMRASFVDRLPDQIVAERFGFSVGYLRVLRHQFLHDKIDFSEAVAEGSSPRRRVDAATRQKIVAWRQRELSAGDIAQLLNQEAIDISVRTIERILAEEGFKKLPRRTQLKIGRTIRGAEVPEVAAPVAVGRLEEQRFESAGAGVFLFAPFIAQLNLDAVIKAAKLPESKSLSAINYFLSILALKLLGTERYAHVGEHVFDPGLGLSPVSTSYRNALPSPLTPIPSMPTIFSVCRMPSSAKSCDWASVQGRSSILISTLSRISVTNQFSRNTGLAPGENG